MIVQLRQQQQQAPPPPLTLQPLTLQLLPRQPPPLTPQALPRALQPGRQNRVDFITTETSQKTTKLALFF